METMVHQALDNPIWRALTTDQRELAEGDQLARRFPQNIGPLAAMAEQSAEAYASFAALAHPEEPIVLFLDEAEVVPGGWILDLNKPLVQMVYEGHPEMQHSLILDELGDADVPQMLALTDLTKPGPFRSHTHQLGAYLGIRQEGQLVAMAGERLDMPGYTEISAVCTHPDYQGKGFAQVLITAVAQNILKRGKTPFLHTGADNTRAIRVYEKLGFQTRRLLQVAVIRLA